MDLCRDASRISESLEGLKMKRESHRNSRGNGEAVRELCKVGRLKKVLQILDYNDPEGKQAYSGAAYASLLQFCAKLKAITEGNQIHAHISKAGFEPDIFLCSTIISMYTKCMSVAEVMEVLDKMLQRDIVSWNAVIAGYAQNEFSMEVSELFAQMQQEGF
jgi:pentatricopeptide repeat protein